MSNDTFQKMIQDAYPLLDQMNQILFFKGLDFSYVDCNSRLVKFSRLGNKKRILDRIDCELPWAEDASFYRNIDKKIIDCGKTKTIMMDVRVASGERITVVQNKKAIRDPSTKRIIGIMASMNESSDASLQNFLQGIKNKDNENGQNKNKIKTQYCIDEYSQYSLTQRESECLFYLLRGMTAKMISRILNVSTRTVEKFIEKIKTKMGVRYRTDLIEKAIHDDVMDIVPASIDLNKFNKVIE